MFKKKYKISKGEVDERLWNLGYNVRVFMRLPFGYKIIEYISVK